MKTNRILTILGCWKAVLEGFLDQFSCPERPLFGERFLDRFWVAPGRPGTPQMAPQTAPRRDQDAPQKPIKNRTPKGPKRDPKRGPKRDRKSGPAAGDLDPEVDGFLMSGPMGSKSRLGASWGLLWAPWGCRGRPRTSKIMISMLSWARKQYKN